MKVKVIGRDWKQTIKDILDEYLEAVKEFDGKYEEVEMDIDDGKYIIISDSDEIYKMDRDALELLVWKVLNDEAEELSKAFREEEDNPNFGLFNASEDDVRDRLNWN